MSMADPVALADRFDPESRALWHLELLGCYAPEDARVPGPFIGEDEPPFDDEYDDDLACTHCGGEGFSDGNDPFWDDCDWSGWGPCQSCRGTGQRRHPWVF